MSKCKKYNRYGISQERVFALGTSKIFLFGNKKIHTKCGLTDLIYVIKSMMSKEFIMHFDHGESVRIVLEDREDLLLLLKMRFMNVCPNKGLRFYGITNSSLKEFKGNSNHGFDDAPDEKFRLKKEEI